MNTAPNAIRILCYGDSNTWGYIPGSGDRYPSSVRWTGVLQSLVGEEYEIIEEGLNARTTNIDDPENEGKNGATYLLPCLQSHTPLDYVILMLGTNDLKKRFDRTAEEIAQGVASLVEIILDPESTYEVTPQILLIAPPVVNESFVPVTEKYLEAGAKSQLLGSLYQSVAEQYQLGFIDLSQHVVPSRKDGYHLDEEAHQTIATLIHSSLLELFAES